MNAASSSSLRTGWITFWIILGVLALTLFVALPIAVTRRAASEFERYQACMSGAQTLNCEPSIAWYLNGWFPADANSTSTEELLSTSSTVSGSASSTLYYSTVPIEQSLIEGFTINAIDVEELGSRQVERAFQAGTTLNVVISTKSEAAYKITAGLDLSEMPDDRTTSFTKTLTRSKEGRSMYSTTFTIPKDWTRNGQASAILGFTLSDAAGKVLQEDARTLSITP